VEGPVISQANRNVIERKAKTNFCIIKGFLL